MTTQTLIFKKCSPLHPELPSVLKPSIGSPTSEKIEKILHSYFEKNQYILGAFLNNTLIAAIGISLNNKRATIRHIAVLEHYRKRGIAKQLLKTILKEFSVDSLYAETDDEGYPFYLHCKFQCTSFFSQYGKRYKCIYYRENMNIDPTFPRSPSSNSIYFLSRTTK